MKYQYFVDKSIIMVLLSLLSLAGCFAFALSTTKAFVVDPQIAFPPSGVDYLDVPKFTGGWYEVLSTQSIHNTIEIGCKCPQVYYSLDETQEGVLNVTNSCERFGFQSTVQGKAKQGSSRYPGQFLVKLDPYMPEYPESPNYIVIKTWKNDDGDYQQALIGADRRDYFWLISRTPTVDQRVLNEAVNTAACAGYDTQQTVEIDQNQCTWSIPLS